jgi:hypothetical protein
VADPFGRAVLHVPLPPPAFGDRLDITGARWGLQGAHAVLKLHALHTNGDFDTYWRYHLTWGAPTRPPRPLPGDSRP